MTSPYVGKVVDLVDPYQVIEGTNQGGKKTPAPRLICHWLDTHPGRWAKIAENGIGYSDAIMGRLGYETGRRNGGAQHYARLPHPEGEPLHVALRHSMSVAEALPAVTRDPFNWTPAELADAVQCARDNLFPVADRTAA
ncbi:MAG: hypothetical protein ACXVYB_00095 [Arthrobacter sp.]